MCVCVCVCMWAGLRRSWPGTGHPGRREGWRRGRWTASPAPSSPAAAAACALRAYRACSPTGHPRATRSGASTPTRAAAAGARPSATTRRGGRPPQGLWWRPRTGPPPARFAPGRGGSLARSSIYQIVAVSILPCFTVTHSSTHSSVQLSGKTRGQRASGCLMQMANITAPTKVTSNGTTNTTRKRDIGPDTVKEHAEIHTGAAILID